MYAALPLALLAIYRLLLSFHYLTSSEVEYVITYPSIYVGGVLE